MLKAKERKNILIMFVSTLVVIFASTAIAMRYDDYVDYVVWGVFLYAALLFVVAIVMLMKEKAT